jgi:Flp pilus assembly protein TadD
VPSASATAAGRNAAAPPSGQPAGATEAGTTDAPAATGATPSSKQDASNAAGAARLKADLETLHKAAIANPKDPRRWTDLARAYTMAGQPRLATAAMRRATNLERRTAMDERVNEAQRVKSVRTGKPRPRTGDPAALPPVPVRRATP